MFLPNILRSALFPHLEVDEELSFNSTRQNYGPGQIDGWSWVEGEEQCFIQTNIDKKKQIRPKIIFAYGDLCNKAPNKEFIEFFSALIDSQEYDVYLWTGHLKRFSTAVPLKSSDEFWAARESVPQDSAEEIKKYLTLQSIAIDNCLILDNSNLKTLLTLCEYNWDSIISNCTYSQRKYIHAKCSNNVSARNTDPQSLTMNPSMDYLEIHDEKNPYYNTGQLGQVICLFIETSNSKLDLSPYKNLKKLVIYSSYGLKTIILPDSNFIESIAIKICPVLEEINLLSCIALKHLKVTECEMLSLNINGIKSLKNVCLSNIVFDAFTLDKDSAIQILILHKVDNLKVVSLSENISLEKLEITYTKDIQHLFLKNLKKLKKVYVCTSNPRLKLELVDLPDLRIMETTTDEAELTINSAPRLHHLKMENKGGNLTLASINDCPNLNLISVEAKHIIFNPKNLNTSPTCKLRLLDLSKRRRLQEISDAYVKSPVSIFSLNHPIKMSNNIKNPVYSAPENISGECTISLSSTLGQAKTKYRTRIIDHISLSEDGKSIHFEDQPKIQNLTLITNQTAALDASILLTKNQGVSYGHYDIQALKEHLFYPLTTMSSQPMFELIKNFYIHSNPKDAVSVYWHKERQQGYVKLNPGFENKPVKILYQYLENHSYRDPFSRLNAVKKLQPQVLEDLLLPPELIKRIEAHIKHIPKLQFLLIKDQGVKNKLYSLDRYCSGSFDLELDENDEDSDIDKLLKLLSPQGCLGACIHRSEVFMILARYLGVPARIIANELHAFCEVPLEAAGSIRWYPYDFGGMNGLYNAPRDAYKNLLEHYVIEQQMVDQPSSSSSNPPVINSGPGLKIPLASILPAIFHSKPTFEEELKKNREATRSKQRQRLFAQSKENDEKWANTKKRYYKKYEDIFQNLSQKQIISSVEELFTRPFHLPPLLDIPKDMDIHQLKNILIRQSKQAHDLPYLYIHDATDFKKFFKPTVLQHGERKIIEGPLCKLIHTGGTLLVNWSNFSAKEIVFFKSILDEEPTLFDESIPKQVKIIGLNPSGINACSAFSSRCQSVTLKPDFLNNASLHSKLPKEEKISIELDLCHRLDWKDVLFGKIKFSGNSRSVTEGFIDQTLKAHHNNISFVFNNPPDDPGFKKIIEQIADEGRFYHNGAFTLLPDNVSIVTQEKDTTLKLKNSDVTLEMPESITRAHCIDIGAHNWHECFERLNIENSKAVSEPGYLHQHRYFYVTGFIPKSQWQILQQYLSAVAHLADTPYTFILAPGAEIESIKNHPVEANPTLINPEDIKHHPHPIMVSNDPDYLSEQLCGENDIIIDVNPQTGFHDLIVKMTVEQDKNNISHVNFNLEELTVLKALKSGKHVILNGELSLSLYNQLLPLLHQPCQLRVNGQLVTAKNLGRLTAVMPNPAIQNLGLTHYAHCSFSDETYKNAFPEYQDQVAKIQQFYQLAQAMPHRGQGMPSKPALTYSHLKHLLRALNNPNALHAQNPIKGLFLYDYTRHGEHYAYLNVISKQLFCPENTKPLQETKLHHLLKKYTIQTRADLYKNAWRILNCLDGKTLSKLLGNEPGAFNLSQDIIGNLWQAILPYFHAPIMEQPKFHLKKRLAQLNQLLADKETRLIFIKGEAGIGKTHTIKELQNSLPLYEGEKNIEQWLLDQSERTKILLLDEANLMQPGTWDFLKGLDRTARTIIYKGKEYPLKGNHKIIATGNPENFPNRSYHELFQHYSETIYFKLPEDHELKETILAPLLQNDLARFSEPLLKVFHLICTCNPLHDYSKRDLKSVAERLIHVIHNKKQGQNIEHLFIQTCITEFASSIESKAYRTKFIARLHHLFPDIPIEKPNPFSFFEIKHHDNLLYLPKEKSYVADKIQQDLEMSQRAIQTGRYYKQAILIEGEAGSGKSTLYKAILELNGYINGEKLSEAKKSQYVHKYYYQINVADKSAHATLEKAFHEGAIVILDELNIDDSLETSLNQLLEGRDSKGQPPQTPGFLLLGSQNPGFLKGRCVVSKALHNRMDMIYMDPFSREELISITFRNKIPFAELFVSAFLQKQQAKPKTVNMRTFFTAIRTVSKDPTLMEDINLLRQLPTPSGIKSLSPQNS
jgi:hypothetical protein